MPIARTPAPDSRSIDLLTDSMGRLQVVESSDPTTGQTDIQLLQNMSFESTQTRRLLEAILIELRTLNNNLVEGGGTSTSVDQTFQSEARPSL